METKSQVGWCVVVHTARRWCPGIGDGDEVEDTDDRTDRRHKHRHMRHTHTDTHLAAISAAIVAADAVTVLHAAMAMSFKVSVGVMP